MEIIASTSIDALVARRDAIARELAAAREACAKAEALYKAGPTGRSSEDFGGGQTEFGALPFGYMGHRNLFPFDETLRGFDAGAWDYLMTASGLLTLMSARAKGEWAEQVREKRTPEFTRENIEATFKDLHGRRSEMFDQGVVDCFKACSWDHKSNSPVKFGKRLIFKGNGASRFGPSYDSKQLASIDDLRRVMAVCEGKPEPDFRSGATHALSGSRKDFFEDEWVEVSGFKNGNLHCKFKRPELAAKLNEILGRRYPNALPAPK